MQWIHLEEQRFRLKQLEGKSTRKAELWGYVQRLARENPGDNPWLLPFIALIHERPEDIDRAKAAIASYLLQAEEKGTRGYLFNIWCFAFPHCRWAIWFDLMRQAGFYSPEDAEATATKFLLIQFRDHHAGMWVKPDPESVDNQTAALVLSSYIIGTVFAEGPGQGHLAAKMRNEAAPRLEAMIGGMPNSGYSGEGSTYQGLIVAFAIPFLAEVLEHLRGEPLFNAPLKPKGTSPRNILEMTRRLWMPGGLLLPWDHYGYQFGITFPLAYLAHRTGDRQCLELLEHEANHTRMAVTEAGWGYDQSVWTLVYWPEPETKVEKPTWTPWAQEEVGAVLVDPSGDHYLMLMWDFTEAMCVRCHVNPNCLVLAYKGVPFSADGSVHGHCPDLAYEGAVFDRQLGAGAAQHLNLSPGCGGSHNCLLVDGFEGLRPPAGKTNGQLADFDPDGQSVTGDVTQLYKMVNDDCVQVRRRSRLVDNRFWLVEDYAVYAGPHTFTSRWWFRPDVQVAENGVDVQTPEGALLQMRCVLGEGDASVKRIEGYPFEPDGCSDRVDFQQSGREARWLYVLWPSETVEVIRDLTEGWAAHAESDPARVYPLHPGALPWLQQEVPITSSWTFETEIELPDSSSVFLRLPRGVDPCSRMWLNGRDVNMEDVVRSKLISALMDVTDFVDDRRVLKVKLTLILAVGQDPKVSTLSYPDSPFQLCARVPDPDLLAASRFEDGTLTVESRSGRVHVIPHSLMNPEA